MWERLEGGGGGEGGRGGARGAEGGRGARAEAGARGGRGALPLLMMVLRRRRRGTAVRRDWLRFGGRSIRIPYMIGTPARGAWGGGESTMISGMLDRRVPQTRRYQY
eukprot:SAG31_NODE_2953_length_4866_cov_7.809104_2_plen_107_part_00